MKPELVAQLRDTLAGRRLPTTEADAATITSHELDRSTRLAVRALLTASDALLVDAAKRRRDLEEWTGRVLDEAAGTEALVARVAELEERPEPGRPWVALAVLAGVTLGLHVCELVAIGVLAWR